MTLRISLFGLLALAVAAAPARAGNDVFEKTIRPIFVARCYECHGGAGKPKGGLRLDSVTGLKKGGDSGAVVVAGKPEKSLLVQAVNYNDQLKMPPKRKLPPGEVAALTAWVKAGAVMPDATADVAKTTFALDGPVRSDHWAFQPVRDPSVPPGRTPIDAFILSALNAKDLTPAAPADKRTLIRRATFDLTGLPPTPEEIEAFLKEESPAAFAKVVDRLLASPAYGERWGRHWLDVARYADSNGMDENLVQANAWRYRDYVIAAFNRDLPFDQFVKEQLAGDLLPGAGIEQTVATGFLSLGPKMLAEDDPVKMQMDIVDEQIDTVGKTFMGLTLGCARCHDHKFDPIPTADYYSLAGIFKSTKVMDHFKVVARWTEKPVATPQETAAHAAAQKRVADKQAEIAPSAARFRRAWTADASGAIALLARTNAAVWLPPPRPATPELAAAAADLARKQAEKTALEKLVPPLPEAMAAGEGTVGNVRVHLRGNHLTLGAEAPRRFPRVIAGDSQTPIPTTQSGRLQFAEWLTRPDHPLTARVLVNRVWHWHFGAGLVRSTDNFGVLGDRPSDPALLDWLARRFVADGWSVKALHRRIMLSDTYQTGGAWNESAAAADPDNRLLWRFPRQRLDAESLRDALLAVGGSLDRQMGGTLLDGGNRSYVRGYPNGAYDKYDYPRRSVYLPVIRSMLYDVFQAFDFADPSTPNGERATTTVAPQALFMLNGKLIAVQSRRLAERLLESGVDDAAKVQRLYERAFGRLPTPAEAARAQDFVRRVEKELAGQKVPEPERRLQAWQSLCRVVLSANEFVYVE